MSEQRDGGVDRYVWVEPIDLLERSGGSLVLYEREIVKLNPLAFAVVGWCREPRTLAELAVLLEGAFGAPPKADLEEASAAVVAELCGRGVLVKADEIKA